jgi:FkbM family methyltransferase
LIWEATKIVGLKVNLKNMMVGTPIGRMYLKASHWKSLRTINFRNPEAAQAIATAILADRLISRICPLNGTFLDIGAHIGSILSDVHHQDPSVKIIAFEADPSKIEHLRSKYPFCELFDVALGEREGTAEFQINTSATGYNTLVADEGSALPTISVRVAALDDLLSNRAVDVIKIDVEGAELGVLIGGEQIIQNSKPTIMFESVGVEVNSLGYSAHLLWEWLNDNGYQIFTPDRLAHDARPLKLESLIAGHHYPFHTHNYFAVSQEKRIAIRDICRVVLIIPVAIP